MCVVTLEGPSQFLCSKLAAQQFVLIVLSSARDSVNRIRLTETLLLILLTESENYFDLILVLIVKAIVVAMVVVLPGVVLSVMTIQY